MQRLTILGGGPAGLSHAFYAHQAGIEFDLFEKSSHLGGLCRTLHHQKHSYDTGAHRFHNRDAEITNDLRELLGGHVSEVSRPSKVLSEGRFIVFPPTPMGIFRSTGLLHLGRIGCDIVKARSHRRPIVSFADFAVQSFGKTLAREFLLNYTEKVWGLPPEQLSPAVATKRLSGMSLGSLLADFFNPWNRTKHLEGTFLYPFGGYGCIVQKMVDSLPGESLRINHEITGLMASKGQVQSLRVGDTVIPTPGRIVSTIPLTLLTRMLSRRLPDEVTEASAGLRFRHIRLIFLRLARDEFTQNASIYIPDLNFCISRVSEPRNRCRSMAPKGETGILAEIPCFAGDEIDSLSNRDLYGRVLAELTELKLVESSWILDWQHHYLPYAYPVYSIDYADRVKLILDSISQFGNLDLAGRNGTFFYSHLHDQMRSSKDYISGLKLFPKGLNQSSSARVGQRLFLT